MSAAGMTPTPLLIRVVRSLRLALHLVGVALGTALFYPWIGAGGRAACKRRWSRQLLAILAVRLDLQPTDAPPGCLIVANHISWMDIFSINALRPAAFISKADVRRWPFIGWWAAQNDTVFLQRGSRGHARLVNTQIDALLNTGIDVVVFPEGTTTDGTHLLSFHAALLQPAIETGRPILPLALSYHDADGMLSRAPSFAGETTLKQCYAAILACRSLTVRLDAAPVIASAGRNRRELSQEARSAIAGLLASRPGFPPASTRPEQSPDPQAE